jgi:uncharacterized protein (DUF2384 family)
MRAARSVSQVPRNFQPIQNDGRNGHLLESLPVLDLLQACRRLGELWQMGPEEMSTLLGTSRTTWFRWLEAADASREPLWTADQRTRALALLRIFEAVGDLHQVDADAKAWPHQPLEGPGFSGRTPLEVMLSGIEGLLLVRDYLNFLLNAWS